MAATPDRQATDHGDEDNASDIYQDPPSEFIIRWDARQQFPDGFDGPSLAHDDLHHIRASLDYARNGGRVVVLPGHEAWQAFVIVTPGRDDLNTVE